MVDFSAPAPVEPKREDWLHDQSQRPEPPESRTRLKAEQLAVILGGGLSVGFAALAFQTWAGWDNVRNLGLIINVSLSAFSGVTLGYLLWRQKWQWAVPALLLALLALAFVGMNLWRATYTEGQDNLRDFFSVAGGVVGAVLLVYLVFAYFWVEATDPTRAPEPEM
ncbi:MAG: hypothetical protein M0R74_00785 [Dehalococcoidia bacterium]|nr:hypothetical protein [Dehalococcoidia bacterium]